MNLPAPLTILVELYLAGAWVDISDDVYGEGDIEVSRGTADWSPDVQPGTCRLKLRNVSGKYSMHNPLSPYYGKLGRNIPLRLSVNGNSRFLGEVSEWPVRSDPNLHVPIEASGVLRRLSKSITEEHSPIYRGMMQAIDPVLKPIGYWPCENVDNNDTILAAAAGLGTPLVVNKSAEGLGTRSGFLGSDQIVTLGNSQMYADIPTYGPASTLMLVGALVRLPDNGVAAPNTPIMTVNTAGTAAYWRIRANIDGTLNLQVADPFTDGGLGGVIATSPDTSWSIAGKTAFVALSLEEVAGPLIAWNLFAWVEGGTTALQATANLSLRTFSRVIRATFGAGYNAGNTAIGHIAAWKYTSGLPVYIQNLVNGWRGELAAVRAARVAQEEGIALATLGSTATSLPMSQQGVKSGLDSMTEAVEADGGVVYEPPNVPTIPIADGEDGTIGKFGTSGATLISSTAQAHSGARSVRGTWGAGSHFANAIESSLVIGYTYTFTAWVYVPSGSTHVKLAILGGASSSPSTLTNTWQKLSLSWVATSFTHTVQVLPNVTPTTGHQFYVDDAIVFADRAGLHFVPLAKLYNQAAALTLNYSTAEIARPFEPVDDDRYLVNDASVSIEGAGDPARYALATGPMSTAAPPNGAGRYAISSTRNVMTGDYASMWARWLVHHGTWLEPRYPQISVDLNRKRALITAAALVEPGSIIVGTNPPAWLPPQQIQQIVFGLTETINVRTWRITYNCAPGRPYDVVSLNDTTFRLATDSTLASTTTAPAAGTSMTISVTSTAAGGRWNTTGPFPIKIMVAPVKGMIGEEMNVTAISGTGLTQTFTVTRGVNGFTVAWTAGSAVFLSKRPTLALGL